MARGNGSDPKVTEMVRGSLGGVVAWMRPVEASRPEDRPAEPSEIGISDLWLEDQPRLIIPEDVFARLVAGGPTHPGALLSALREVATTDPYCAEVLARLGDLARSIRVSGVHTPLLVSLVDGQPVVRDGHRRSLAALLAERPTVPVTYLTDEASPVESAATQLVVNLQRENLNAVEKARWLLRIAALAEDEVRANLGLEPGVTALARWREAEETDAEDVSWQTYPPAVRELARQVQERVCNLTGLTSGSYYNLLRLNRLTPEARALGMGLAEGQLRPIVRLPRSQQAEIASFVARRNLGKREATTLVEVALRGDRDEVARVMARLAREESRTSRAAVSWEPLLHAVPRDLSPRLAALHAELEALPDDRRAIRLQSMREQRALMAEVIRTFDEMLALHGELPSES